MADRRRDDVRDAQVGRGARRLADAHRLVRELRRQALASAEHAPRCAQPLAVCRHSHTRSSSAGIQGKAGAALVWSERTVQMQPTWTCRHSSSAVEYTATVFRPSSLHALMTRTAISPRLAISTLVNRLVSPPPPLVAARGRTASPLLQRGAAACSACNGSPVSQPHKLLLCNGRGAGLAAGGRTATPLALRSAQACRTAHISAQITRSGAERGPSPPPHLGQERAGLHCSRQHLCMYCWQAM